MHIPSALAPRRVTGTCRKTETAHHTKHRLCLRHPQTSNPLDGGHGIGPAEFSSQSWPDLAGGSGPAPTVAGRRNGGPAPVQCPVCLRGQLWVRHRGANVYSYASVATSGCLGPLGLPDTLWFPCRCYRPALNLPLHLSGVRTPRLALASPLPQNGGFARTEEALVL